MAVTSIITRVVWLLLLVDVVGGDTIPPTALCSLGNGENLPCISAQYPSHLQVPTNIVEADLKFHFENGVLGPGCENVMKSSGMNHVLVTRRGGCSFTDKAYLASSQGYIGIMMVNFEGTNDVTVPNLQGLDTPLPPSVVLINDDDFHRLDSEVLLSIRWDDWAPRDSTSMYYDGIRLGKEGKYREAAEMHLKAVVEMPSFKSPAYEYINNLLRGGMATKDLIHAIIEVKVLPIDTKEGLVELKKDFFDMVARAHARIFRQGWSPVSAVNRFKSFLSTFYHKPSSVIDSVKSFFTMELVDERDVIVICVATDETPELSALRTSVRTCGYELVVLGLGAEYGSSGGTKLALMEKWLLEGFSALNKSDDTLLLFVDAYDVILTPAAKHLVQVFSNFNASMVISGETGCWPDPGVAPAYPWPLFHQQPHFGHLYQVEDHVEDAGVSVPFPYPNSGGYVGRAGYMRKMIVEVMEDVREGHLKGGGTIGDADDQRWLQRHWLRHSGEVAIDVMAEIFLSLHRLQLPLALGHTYASLLHPLNFSTEGDPSPEEVAVLEAHAGMTAWMKLGETAVRPLVLHGNGQGKRMFRVISCKLGLFCKWAIRKDNTQDDEISHIPFEQTEL